MQEAVLRELHEFPSTVQPHAGLQKAQARGLLEAQKLNSLKTKTGSKTGFCFLLVYSESMKKKPGPKGPSKYSQKMVKKTKKYTKMCEDEQIQVLKQENAEKGYQMFEQKTKVNLPSVEGLAFYLKVNVDTIYDWKKKYPDFSEAIGELHAKQTKMLLSKGLSGEYNSTIAKLILASRGYREKMDVKVGEFSNSEIGNYS